MRAFIAIELSLDLKKRLASLEEQLKSSGGDVKWVKPENIHLTLKFLGEIDERQLGEVAKIIQETAVKEKPFYMRLASPGAFPKMEPAPPDPYGRNTQAATTHPNPKGRDFRPRSINFPRVIWIGIDKGDSETKQIAKILEEEIVKLGIPRENRPFSSHITLGRVRSGLNREKLVKNLEYLASNLPQDSPEFLVTKITLFKSTLTPNGPIYEVLKESQLQGN